MENEKTMSESEFNQHLADSSEFKDHMAKLMKEQSELHIKIVETLIGMSRKVLEHKLGSSAVMISSLQDLLDHPTKESEKRRAEIEDLLKQLREVKPE